MRDTRFANVERSRLPLIILVAALVSWLVIQNVTLLLLWSWPAMPALLTTARALLKVGVIVAVQMMPATRAAGGVAMLWRAARRTSPLAARRFEEARHV